MFRLLIVVAVLATLPSLSRAQSEDAACAGSADWLTVTVCSDPDLSRLNLRMSEALGKLRDGLSTGEFAIVPENCVQKGLLARVSTLERRADKVDTLPDPEQAYVVEPFDATFKTTQVVRIRKGPDEAYPMAMQMMRQQTVKVTGKVTGRNWLRIDLPGGGTGYVPTNGVRPD